MRIAWLVLAGCSAAPVTTQPDAAELTWATYHIATGSHDAKLTDREIKDPVDGLVTVVGRDFDFVLDPSARYELTMPTQPEDQLDWNKLPGLSDCGTIDLSVDGAMFAWRWNLDAQILELMAYANNASHHLWLDAPIFTLDADDLAAQEPLQYEVWRETDVYRYSVTGSVRGRVIDVSATQPRRCSDQPTDPLAWAGGFYFGGTSVAPHDVTGRIRERVYESRTSATNVERIPMSDIIATRHRRGSHGLATGEKRQPLEQPLRRVPDDRHDRSPERRHVRFVGAAIDRTHDAARHGRWLAE